MNSDKGEVVDNTNPLDGQLEIRHNSREGSQISGNMIRMKNILKQDKKSKKVQIESGQKGSIKNSIQNTEKIINQYSLNSNELT